MTFCTLPFSSGDVVRILKKLDNATFSCNLFGDIPYFDHKRKKENYVKELVFVSMIHCSV